MTPITIKAKLVTLQAKYQIKFTRDEQYMFGA